MPVIGLGTSKLSTQEAIEASKVALSAGYLHFDTAQYYGNQNFFFQLQTQLPKDITRDSIFLVSKVWIADFGGEKNPQSC